VQQLAIIQIGAGSWGKSWAELVRRTPGVRLAAIVDGAVAAREWASAGLGVPAFARHGQALRSVEADAVLLVSPPSTHRRLAEDALERGLHVLSEKPFALRVEDARAVLAAAKRAKRLVMVSQNYRFQRQSRAVRSLVASRALGRLLGIRIACRRDLRNSWISPRDWRGQMKHPYLMDMAIHHVDLLRMITGREVVRVDARGWRVPDSPFAHEATVEALLALDDGTPVAYEGTWAATRPETSWNGEWELVGERGRATWTGGAANALRSIVAVEHYGLRPARVELPRLPAVDRAGVLFEFRRSIGNGTVPEASLADNVKSLGAVLALARSVEAGTPVRV